MSWSGFDLARFEEEPALGIIRGCPEGSLQGVMEILISAGLRFVEITLNNPNALNLIETSNSRFSDSLTIGAGTVLSVNDAERAVSAGARFLVAPSLNEDVAAYCREHRLAYFPGALTPTEIERAWNAGAAMVKLFPASQMGPGYFKMVKGPFQDIRLLAVGGINHENLSEYFNAGASAVAVGGSILSPARMKNKEFHLIEKEIKEFLLAVRKFFSKIGA